jgi:hypothetical protein
VKAFWKGAAFGSGAVILLAVVILAFRFFWKRDGNIIKYMEARNEIQALREDYGNRNPYEFLNDRDIRSATDGGIEYYRRRRDELLQQYGSGDPV